MDTNFLRGIIFTQAAFVFIMTLAIVIRYALLMTVTKREDRAKPWHIVLIGISYLWAVIYICIEVRIRWDLPSSWRIPNAAGIFILGDFALIYMLSHLLVQRNLAVEINARALDILTEEKRELAEELKRQTSGLAQMIRSVGQKADDAYHEANDVNQKILGANEDVSNRLDDIKTNAETARVSAKSASDNAEQAVTEAKDIGETGKDTNVRVRRMEGRNKPSKPTKI